MRAFHPRTIGVTSAILAASISTIPLVNALQPRPEPSRFDRLVIADPSVIVSPSAVQADSAGLPESFRGRWASFEAGSGKALDVTIDSRSGVPLLVQGEGIPMIPGSGNDLRAATPVTLDSLAGMLRSFLSTNRSLALTADAELTLNREGSGLLKRELWKVIFDRTVGGVPVAGDRWIFYVGHGNLIAYGATRWSPIATSTDPAISAETARGILFEYMGLTDAELRNVVEEPTLVLVPMAAAGTAIDSYSGSVGAGYDTALAWQLSVEVPGEPGKWSALVDAHKARVLAFDDTIQYAHAKGGVQPISSDGICPDGCQQPNFPMPFADITIGGSNSTASSMGSFSCLPGGSTATTTLAGPFVRVVDSCGAISQSVTCNADLDLSMSAASDCSVPPGASAGNTRAARSSFYHLNRIKEHAKVWLPANNWLPLQLRDNVNINSTCNAFWSDAGLSGTVNFYRSGGGCGNTGEIAAVFLHEWGHGLDQNDGGGYDNPSEAYADVTAFMLTHSSCIGRGFRATNCTGYGNACTSCTGVRDQDWDKRASHAPQTPTNWPGGCPTGSGPCGRETHCEAYLSGQTVWDLAVRDLPASGLDQATAWQVMDRMWFASRSGSGGSAYTCGATVANRSCAANSWYTGFRAIDDDDGNLANGTPHAAAIFAAFDRHAIPCGAAADASNQSFSNCPALPAPAVTATPTAGQIELSWSAVPGASSYNVLRNDQGCGWAYTIVANVAGTTYTDLGLPNTFPLYYSIQAVGADDDCLGTLSACTTAFAGGPHAIFTSQAREKDSCLLGGIGHDDGYYDAGEEIEFSVTIRNDGVSTLNGVTATVTPTTPGVIMIDDTASFGTIAAGTNATSIAPHFTAQLPPGLACGSQVSYDLTIDANQGSWTESFTQTIGLVTPVGGTALSENFASGIPATWTIVNGGNGVGGAATWTTGNPGSRAFPPPMVAPVAMVDSDLVNADTEDEQLITPVMNLATATSVTLNFDEYFRFRAGGLSETGDVDVRSTQTGGAWVTVLRNQSVSSGSAAAAGHRTINITAQAAGASDAQVRFHYYNAANEYWWMLDNIVITYSEPPTCATNPCITTSADLEVAKSGPPTGATGQNLSYAIQVTNNGPDPAANVELDDAIPANTTFVSLTAPQGWSCSTPPVGGTGTISCTAPTMLMSASAGFTVVVRARECAGEGTIVTNTAEVSSATPDPSSANDSSSAMTTLSDNGTCDDGDACTLSDACQAGTCVGFNPVICAALDACHIAGTCNQATGVCDNPDAPNGTPCDDGDECSSDDECSAGTCSGAPVGAPPEVANLMFSTKTNRTWSGFTTVGPPVTYDVVRGALGEWPVGSGASELCQASGTSDTFVDVADDPASDSGFWYLVRGRNACGTGTYGDESSGPERVTTVCP